MTDQTFNYVQVEAALCVWEWMTDRHRMADASTGPVKDLLDLWYGVGAGQMRNLAARVAPAVETLYQELCAEIGEDDLRDVYCAYDWDFVPAVCERMDWAGQMTSACYTAGGLLALPETLKPDLVKEFGELKAKQDADRAEREKLEAYKAECRTAAGRLWGYPGLVDDDPETIRRAFENGDDPAELIEQLGDELDLDRPDPITAQERAEQYPVRDNS